MWEDKALIVTGGASGIGRATAVLLAESGAAVMVSDRDEAGAQATAAELVARGMRVEATAANIGIENDVKRLVARTISAFGRLDGAANVAGRASHSLALHELSEAQWNDVIRVNLTGAFFCLKHQIAGMLETGGGALVVVSSVAALKAFPGVAEYAASKAGLGGLMRSAALEYGKKGIRVNSVLPGSVDTPMTRGHMEKWPELKPVVDAQHMVGRQGNSEEIAHAIRWLLSDEARFVTGMEMRVDGGLAVA